MLWGLMIVSVLLFWLLGLVAYRLGLMEVFYCKITLAIVMMMLLAGYWHRRDTLLFASLFLLLIELEAFSAILGAIYYRFVAVYPFFVVLGFFYFYSMRTALWLTFGHLLTWSLFVLLSYQAHSDNPVYDLVTLVSLFSSIFVVVLAGIIYHVSTEITFQRLKHAHAQKALLIQEIHHRTKNNLNKIASTLGLQILRLQRGYREAPERTLEKNKLRIEAMVLVHEALYRSHNLNAVDAKTYLDDLISLIEKSYGRSPELTIDADAITLPPETMLRLGTVVNELYTNTLWHTRPHDPICVSIHLQQHGNAYEMIYRQSGHATRIDPHLFEESRGLGMMLVRLSVQEMQGYLVIESTASDLRFGIVFASHHA